MRLSASTIVTTLGSSCRCALGLWAAGFASCQRTLSRLRYCCGPIADSSPRADTGGWPSNLGLRAGLIMRNLTSRPLCPQVYTIFDAAYLLASPHAVRLRRVILAHHILTA